MNSDEKRIALLIDADNALASKVDVVLTEVAKHGVANVRRAYGDWKSPHLQQWEAALHPYGIRPMQQFAYSTGKNASDMAMVIDAMDLLQSGSVDAFALVSSHADFTPLVMRIWSSPRPGNGACCWSQTAILYRRAPSGRSDPKSAAVPAIRSGVRNGC